MLRGRTLELELVGQFLDEVIAGQPHILIIEGEAGIGKTRLVTEVLELARVRGWDTLYGAAEPTEQARPFAAIGNVLGLGDGEADWHHAEVAELLRSAERSDPEVWVDPNLNIGFRVTDSVVDLLGAAGDRGPVLIALDDLHWADRPSTQLLATVQRRLAGEPIALVATQRSGAAPPHVLELADQLAPVTKRLLLAALPSDAIAQLAGELAGGAPDPELCRQLDKVGGNPFFASELIRALIDEGTLSVEGGMARARTNSVPRGLSDTVSRRLRLLPQKTCELLKVASVLGQSFSCGDLAVVSERSPIDVLALLTPALEAGTLREAGQLVTFGHALTWEVIYQELPKSGRQALHRHVARSLAAAGVPAMRLAQHFELGADVGDTQAIEWLCQAARGAAPGSPSVAAGLLESALRVCAKDSQQADAITAELAPLLVVTGRVDEAMALTDRAFARILHPKTEAKLRVGLTHVLMRAGRVDDARDQVDKLLELLPPAAAELAKGVASYVHWAGANVDLADELAQQALMAGERAGHDVVVATALMTLTWTNASYGRIDAAIAAGRRAVSVTESSMGPFAGLLFPHGPLGGALLQADLFDEATAMLAQALRRADSTSAPGTVVYHHGGLAVAKFLTGDWGDAVSEAEVALELAESTGTTWALIPSAIIARIAVARGELTVAERVLGAAECQPEASHRNTALNTLHWARAMWLDAAGDAEVCARALRQSITTVAVSPDLLGNRIMPIDCVRLALARGMPALAREIADRMQALAEQASVASLSAAAHHCRGLAESDPEAHLSAVTLLHGSPRSYQLAMAREDAGLAVLADHREKARGLLQEALNGYRTLGADRDTARLTATMRGHRMRTTTDRKATGTQADALTKTEQAVAALVAEGLSNLEIAQRLYISRHTVETHLKHIFRKLGLSSRTKLAAQVISGRAHI